MQYRDAGAPFGYDLGEISSTDAALALYHTAFTQTYDIERRIDIRRLILRLEPQPNPKAFTENSLVWVLAEAGLGPALVHYFVRSQVDAEAVSPSGRPRPALRTPPSCHLFRLSLLPPRLRTLLSKTPGLALFSRRGRAPPLKRVFGIPSNLAACPVFDERGLVLFRGHGFAPAAPSRLRVRRA